MGKTQAEIAREIDVDSSFIDRIEKESRGIKGEKAERLMQALQVPMNRQTEFLLLAADYSPERVKTILTAAGGIEVSIDPRVNEYNLKKNFSRRLDSHRNRRGYNFKQTPNGEWKVTTI